MFDLFLSNHLPWNGPWKVCKPRYQINLIQNNESYLAGTHMTGQDLNGSYVLR